MAGLAALSYPPPLLSLPSLQPALLGLTSSSTSLSFRQNHNFRSIRNPRSRTKLKGLGEQVEDQLEEAFFGIHHQDIQSGDEGEDDEDEEEMEESSLDLLFRFVQSLFYKVSKKARRATRSVLPPFIAPQLVSFAVDGVLLLTSLSILRAFLEVVCTLGGTVFIAILLLRLVWATISHFQSSGYRFNNGGNSYGPTQPVT